MFTSLYYNKINLLATVQITQHLDKTIPLGYAAARKLPLPQKGDKAATGILHQNNAAALKYSTFKANSTIMDQLGSGLVCYVVHP